VLLGEARSKRRWVMGVPLAGEFGSERRRRRRRRRRRSRGEGGRGGAKAAVDMLLFPSGWHKLQHF
jgi:hypothetical protein